MSHEAYFGDNAPATAETMLDLYSAGLKMALDLELEPQRLRHGMHTRAYEQMERPLRYEALFSTFAIYQQAPDAGKHLDALGLGPQFTELSMSHESTRVLTERIYELDPEYWKYPVYGESGKPLSHIYLIPGEGQYLSHPRTEARLSLSACQPAIESGKEVGAVETWWDAEVLIENDYKVTGRIGTRPGTRSELTQIQCQRLISLAGILAQHPKTLDEEDC